jgi:hypothetical protein
MLSNKIFVFGLITVGFFLLGFIVGGAEKIVFPFIPDGPQCKI